MPLLDVDWKERPGGPLAFLGVWAASVADALNGQLPADRGFLAWVDTRSRQESVGAAARLGPPDGAAPTLVTTARFTDRIGVSVVEALEIRLAAAVVLFVTPDNKADSDAALAFAVRAAGFMSGGAGVVIVDALPGPASWATHLHSLTGVYPIARRPRGTDAPIFVVHPSVQGGAERFVVWHHAVAPGFPLPTVPVPVRGAMHLKLDLEATYAEACRNSRLPE